MIEMVLSFYILDVFAEQKYTGNQLAVFPDASGLTDREMQEIAREMHFSETTFIDPVAVSDQVYRVRIFTPEHEVPFAGHPVLGTAYVIRQEFLGGFGKEVTLSLMAGRIPVTFASEDTGRVLVWMRQNHPVFSRKFPPDILGPVLSLPEDAIDLRFQAEEVSTGLPFVIVPLISRRAVQSARINRDAYYSLISGISAKAVYIFCSEPFNAENTLNARMFGDYYGVPEDPATGSAAGCLTAYLLKNRYFSLHPEVIRIEQGYEIHRPSLLLSRAWMDGDHIRIEVGGAVIPVARGEISGI